MVQSESSHTGAQSSIGATAVQVDGGGRRPMVLQVLPAFETGGVERGALEIAAALVDAGGTALVASRGGRLEHDLARAGGRHLRLPVHSKNPLVIRANARRLARIIRAEGVDIIHARSRAPAWAAWLAARRTGCRFVTTVHGPYSCGGLKQRYNAVMARGDRVIAISGFIAGYLEANYGIAPPRVQVIHRGVDTGHFDPGAVGPQRLVQLAEAWRLPEDRPVVLMPGRLTRWKGQSVLIEALGRLGAKKISCVIVGSDQGRAGYRRELERAVARLGLGSVVHLVGDCRDMAAAYMLADVVVSASTDPEAFGRVIVEAQAMGRAVIATDHGAARETVRDGETGWLVPPGDAGTLADTLGVALSLDAQARARVADIAIPHVRETFSTAAMCARTLALYEEVLGRGEPASAAA
jgi:glycosyltransferase involved in cell wall biosynthesis